MASGVSAFARTMSTVTRRQRLPAAVRTQQILDAALAEFSRQGYTAARMEDIAQAARLSKGGLYAHFPSKEALLQTLLERLLERPLVEQQDWWPDHVQTLEQLVNAFVDHTLQRLAEPTTLPVLRLLLAESPRLPPAMRDWHQRMLQLHAQTHTRLMQRAIDQGLLPANPAPLDCSLLLVPLLHSVFMILASGQLLTQAQLDALRPQHQALLLRLLRPAPCHA